VFSFREDGPVDKSRITPEVVRCLLRSQFPAWADLPVSAVELDGWDNTTFRLGTEMSVRLPSADVYVPQVDKEHRWLPVLAENLPLPIPQPLARGGPGCGYPRPWSIYRWLDGQPATEKGIADLVEFAVTLADFLSVMYSIDTRGGPPAGEHSFFRGGPLLTYDDETRSAIVELAGEIDAVATIALWEEAIATQWTGPPVWVHGDVGPSNLLVVDGRLAAVIDFGCAAIGDPACDTVIAWTFLYGQSRAAFRARLPVDEGTWARGRGWALWKALVTLAETRRRRDGETNHEGPRFGWRHDAKSVIEDLLTDQEAGLDHDVAGRVDQD